MEITVIHGPGEAYDLATVMRIRNEQVRESVQRLEA